MSRRGLDLPRSSGVLLHVTSLPGGVIGELGEAAFRWVDWLVRAGQTLWQILPLVPVDRDGSPYNGLSALAGNALLVSPESLVADGLLQSDAIPLAADSERVDFAGAIFVKGAMLEQAFQRFRAGAAPELRAALDVYRRRNAAWLEDYALFRAIRQAHQGAPWTEWERPVRLRQQNALAEWRVRARDEIDDHVFQQFLFDRQWSALRRYANARGIKIIGDVPIFVAADSADVWANQDLFQLGEDGRPDVVSGVPPDYFSETGQLWGNPLYRWDRMRERGFPWWTERFRRTLEQVDFARIDHFRGFESYWEIPADALTAREGRWVRGPGTALFDALQRRLGRLPLIAEDLGMITAEVDLLRDQLGLPGMRVLQFAFDGDPDNPHLPENHPRNAVSYTGTHDNPTVASWWRDAEPEQRDAVRRLVPVTDAGVHWDLIRLAFASRAQAAVVPLQDVLGLGEEGRMNTPGTTEANWTWRLTAGSLSDDACADLLDVTRAASRSRAGADPDSSTLRPAV